MELTKYTQKQKEDALKLWLVTGNLSQVSRDLKINFETLKYWRYSKWWKELSQEIQAEGRMEMSAKLRKIAEKALDETLDRLENGEIRISPTGEAQRIPVSAAVTARVAADFLNQAQELEKIQVQETIQGVNDRLKALADNFEKFSRKVRKIEVEDVDVVEHSPASDGPVPVLSDDFIDIEETPTISSPNQDN